MLHLYKCTSNGVNMKVSKTENVMTDAAFSANMAARQLPAANMPKAGMKDGYEYQRTEKSTEKRDPFAYCGSGPFLYGAGGPEHCPPSAFTA